MIRIIQTKSTRDQRLVPQHVIYYDGGKDRVLYVYSLVQGQDREFFLREVQKEGFIERISLSGKFRRARKA